MELIGTYQIDDLTVVNPTIKVRQVNDNIVDKTCLIEVIFNIEGALINYSRNISGFTYLITWDDLDIENFIDEKMKELRIDVPNNLRQARVIQPSETPEVEQNVEQPITQETSKQVTKVTKNKNSLLKRILSWMKLNH